MSNLKLENDLIDAYVGDGHDIHTLGKRTPMHEDGSFMKENEHNDPVADELVRLLIADLRFNVIYVSPEDTYKALRDRVNIANDHYVKNGRRYKRSIYISVHANAAGRSGWNDIKGTETLYNKGSILGKHYAECIQRNLVEALGSPDRGIKERDNLYILRETDMPAVITEALFMTNKEDAEKLLNHEYRMKEAFAVYKGMCEGFNIAPMIEKSAAIIKIVVVPGQKEDLLINTKEDLSADKIIKLIQTVETEIMIKTGKDIVEELTVMHIQNDLNNVGYYCGDVDDIRGFKTDKAILAFQRLNDLIVDGEIGPQSIACIERLKESKDPHRTMWFNDSEVNLFSADLDDYDIGVGLGVPGRFEKLSEMTLDCDAAINGQFFGGGREGLGALITKGLFYFKAQNDIFTNWIHYKDNHVEIRDVKDSELHELQQDTNFTIGTSWSLIVDGIKSIFKWGGINHKFFRHPRTLLNKTECNKTIFITIDGRSKISKGMTAKQCQELLDYIEFVFGIKITFSVNLDGGGSTEMIVNEEIVNVPSGGSERRIGTFLYVKRRK